MPRVVCETLCISTKLASDRLCPVSANSAVPYHWKAFREKRIASVTGATVDVVGLVWLSVWKCDQYQVECWMPLTWRWQRHQAVVSLSYCSLVVMSTFKQTSRIVVETVGDLLLHEMWQHCKAQDLRPEIRSIKAVNFRQPLVYLRHRIDFQTGTSKCSTVKASMGVMSSKCTMLWPHQTS